MQENEDRKERKKKKYLFCESMSAFIVVFLIKTYKVLTAVINIVIHLVYVRCENVLLAN